MKEGKTKSGFEYTFDERKINDMEFIDALADVISGEDVTKLSTVMRKLFIPEDRKRLYDHVREEDGRVPTERIFEEIQEIIEVEDPDGKK